ncbi:metallophosphoesterase [Aquimarina macrocephali]|uniref:metallophosphoesterase n=1 Tax=Aquimarina macrocephali TaxID=666563 RepID=UPI003F66EB0E
MKIAIISDIHENFHNLILALEEIERQNCKHILCLGDLMNAGIAKVLSCSTIPVFTIWGNNDGEKVEITKVAHYQNSNLSVSLNTYDFLEIDNRKIFISHYDDLAIPMATSRLYDAVFFGHTHISSIQKENETWIVNPGEISAHKTGIASLAIYDTDTNDVKILELENSKTLKTGLVTEFFKKNKEVLQLRSEKAFNM